MSRSGQENLLLLGALVLAGFLVLGVVSAFAVYSRIDNDGDGKNAVFDNDDTSGGGRYSYTNLNTTAGGSGGVRYVLGFGVDVGRDGKFTEAGDVTPDMPDLETGDVALPIVITSLDMDTELHVNSLLYRKIYVLPPETPFKAKVGIYVDRDIPLPVRLELNLLEGNLGTLAHMSNNNERLAGFKDLQGLKKGSNTVEISGVTPGYNPGHDWHLPQVVVYVDQVEKGDKTFWRGDDPSKPKWMTLRYYNDWCALPKDVFEECVDSTLSAQKTAGMTLGFNVKSTLNWKQFIGLGRLPTRIIVYEMTYPGKYKKLYDGPPTKTSELEQKFEVYVPYSEFVSVGANEAYVKVVACDQDGNYIDLNSAGGINTGACLQQATGDVAARVNIDVDVSGSSMWKGDQEYFNVLGRASRLFSVTDRGHPEAELFR